MLGIYVQFTASDLHTEGSDSCGRRGKQLAVTSTDDLTLALKASLDAPYRLARPTLETIDDAWML